MIRVKDSLKTQALVCVLNIGLNFFLVFHTPLGFRGIAVATASSVFIGSIVNLWKVRSSMTGVRKFSLDLVRRHDHHWLAHRNASGVVAIFFNGPFFNFERLA